MYPWGHPVNCKRGIALSLRNPTESREHEYIFDNCIESMADYETEVVGPGVKGRDLALNLERNGCGVIGFDLSQDKRGDSRRNTAGKNLTASSLQELAGKLN